MKKIKKWLLPYRQALPALLLYQIIAAFVTELWLWGFSQLAGLLIRSTGRAAISSGDFLFLFTTWQGYVIMLLTVITLFVFVAVDINALVILCGRILKGEKPSVLLCFKEGFISLRRFINLRGLAVILFLSVLSPILSFGVSISLTRNFYIPKFISSVIYSKPLYLIGVGVVFAALIFIGVIYIFILHGTLLDNMSLKESARSSTKLIKTNVKNFIKSMLLFFVMYGLVIAAHFVITVTLFLIKYLIPMPDSAEKTVSLCLTLIVAFVLLYIVAMYMPFYVLKITMLYRRYRSGGEWEYQERKKRISPLVIANAVIVVSLIAGITVLVSLFGEAIFPDNAPACYIAHRAGGNEAPENTVAGINAAYSLGAYGSEIDIQRTSDGYYIVNHDRISDVRRE